MILFYFILFYFISTIYIYERKMQKKLFEIEFLTNKHTLHIDYGFGRRGIFNTSTAGVAEALAVFEILINK
jgi:hypothetical protein